MNLEDRDYEFTDEQVKALGFNSYEELEQYYDLLYGNMENHPWNKQQCFNELKNMGLEHRLGYSRQDRLKSVIEDSIGVITDWNDTTWKPSLEEISTMKDCLAKNLNMYFKFVEKQAIIDMGKSSHHL